MTGQTLPTCSVVICTHNRPDALEACLAAVSAGPDGASEVVVVDSAPEDDGGKRVAARWGARYVREDRPGVSRARNRGAFESGSEVVAYVDGDAVPEPGWLLPLLAEFVDPDVAAVAGRVLPPEPDMESLPIYSWFGITDHGAGRRVFDRSAPRWFVQANFESVLLGANMAVRRSAFAGWRGFDERIGAGTRIYGGEEPLAFFELVAGGNRVVYAPSSVVRHAFPHSMNELRRRALRAIESSAAYITLLFFEKPAYRKETWRYIKGKLARRKALYSRETAAGRPLVPGWRVLAARIKGVWLYIVMRLKGGRP